MLGHFSEPVMLGGNKFVITHEVVLDGEGNEYLMVGLLGENAEGTVFAKHGLRYNPSSMRVDQTYINGVSGRP